MTGKLLRKNKPEILQIRYLSENSIEFIDKTKKYFSEINETSKKIRDGKSLLGLDLEPNQKSDEIRRSLL
ncbi:hypothetical protein CLOSBL3_20165 [Clostridiaceae bacterium BL-3]|nr:hypothetical protein CLOSBL3_20165 [Clostridiaceae bacterium BL-3]